jgi:hypothetical protein
MVEGMLPLIWMCATFGSMLLFAQAMIRLRRSATTQRIDGLVLIGLTCALIFAASRLPYSPLPALVGMLSMGSVTGLILRRPQPIPVR